MMVRPFLMLLPSFRECKMYVALKVPSELLKRAAIMHNEFNHLSTYRKSGPWIPDLSEGRKAAMDCSGPFGHSRNTQKNHS
jgi:hypothetical protein